MMAPKSQPASRKERGQTKDHPESLLLEAAWEVRERAVATYSGFKVGAALLTEDGRIYTGCNIENSTYGLTVCAERVAIFKALSEGAGPFVKIAVVTESPRLTPPCGSCRQLLWEFCGDIEILMANRQGRQRRVRLSKLFPEPFEKSFFRPNDK